MTTKCYQKHEERLLKEAHERYQNLSEEGKEKRSKKVQERYQNLSEKTKGEATGVYEKLLFSI